MVVILWDAPLRGNLIEMEGRVVVPPGLLFVPYQFHYFLLFFKKNLKH